MHSKRSNAIAALSIVSAAALMLPTGCTHPVATGSQSFPPVSGSYGAASTDAPVIDRPAYHGDASFSDPSFVRAGSFPRSFLIPGTDTSLRIGG